MKKYLIVSITCIVIFGIMHPAGLLSEDQAPELTTRRFAFMVGANNGGKDRVLLRYAVADARAVQKVLEEMGGVLPGDTRFLIEPTREGFFREIRALARDVLAAQAKHRRVEVIFYYSGHSDEESIFLGESRITYSEFRDFITSMDADVRIAIIDSCASGALTLTKGVIKKSPFLMDTAYDMKGYAFMTSSSASEAAQESSRLKRSYFTHNLISGMRGAADMNQDSRITLNEAYQFAFDGTLNQTEKTMAGPQHPSYHIMMSGTGDVVITELWKSTAVLVLEKEISGKIYVHNSEDVLVVELKKTAGREISIGLEAGKYRIININNSGIHESRCALRSGESTPISGSQFTLTDRIPTQLRGQVRTLPREYRPRKLPGRWRFEMFSGFSSMDPADLNLRVNFDEMYNNFYGEDYLNWQKGNGEIASYGKFVDGGGGLIDYAVPFGFRFRYAFTNWLDVSLGITRLSRTSDSRFSVTYDVQENDGSTTSYTDNFTSYKLSAQGVIPYLGIHVGKDLTSFLRGETFITAGPLFAECAYTIDYLSQSLASGPSGDFDDTRGGILEERGSGIGLALHAGTKLDVFLTRRFGVFVEGGYAYLTADEISGPGNRSITAHRETWEGEWGIKEDIRERPWGIAHFLWPSNAWSGFEGTWWKSREFELDLSGFQARLGLIVRF